MIKRNNSKQNLLRRTKKGLINRVIRHYLIKHNFRTNEEWNAYFSGAIDASRMINYYVLIPLAVLIIIWTLIIYAI